MQELWSSASYQPHLLSLLFAFAPAAMLIVVAYGIVMRGEPVLRAWMLVHFVALLPYTTTVMLSPSIVSPGAAEALYKLAGSCIPMAAAAGLGSQLRLLGKQSRLVWAGVAAAAVWLVVGTMTDAVVDGVVWLPPGFWFAHAAPGSLLTLVTTLAVSLPGFVLLARAALRDPPSQERRQLRLVLVANLTTYAGLVDVSLAFGIGVFPLGWLLSGIGSLLVVRALIVEDLLRARAVDTTAPELVLHLAAAIVLGWVSLRLFGPTLAWWGTAIVLALSFASVRIVIAVIGLVNRNARAGEGPLDRLLGQLVVRARAMRNEAEIARLAIDIVQLALGQEVRVLVAAAEDWGWTDAAGQRIDDALAPDPLLVGWLAEQRAAIFADDLAYMPRDVRGLLSRLFERHAARTIVPVVSHDELIALVIAPTAAKLMRGRSLDFVQSTAARLGEAIVHARMARRAEHRAMLAREAMLAGTVQAQLLPSAGPHVHGGVTVVGSWLPAQRCAGDFWGVYKLDADRTLVAIGDVTGHGVASATVTAAAVAACDVAVRRHRANLDLDDLVKALDAAVRRVGGGELTMTCFATIVDAAARELRFVSCGHTAPYLCRAGEREGVELHALVGRGNPLGGHAAPAAKLQHKQMRAGDLVVWYTDGVIDAQDPAGEPFGDRRLQRMLKKLDRTRLTPGAVHDVVHAAIATHRAGTPPGDDETLVVGQWLPGPSASLEPARSA